MNPDKLLDAFGMIDDRFFAAAEKSHPLSVRKRSIVLIAAILLLAFSVGTAMAVSQDFQALILSIFQIETHEQPPTESADDPAVPILRELDVVNIDGIVHAHYFSGKGTVLTYDGGFYTYTQESDATFWEIRTEGIADVGANRIHFPLVQDSRTLQIIFDYAVLNGKLCIKPWPQNLNENPIGNGWNAEPIPGRTDAALLSVPVSADTDYTHDFLLLDLSTLKTTDLLEAIPRDDLLIDICHITSDLHYALLTGVDRKTGSYGHWFCDLKGSTITPLADLTGKHATEPYFLNDSTIIFQEAFGDGQYHVVSYSIATGMQEVVVENASGYRGIQQNGGHGVHGLLFAPDRSLTLIDLQTHMRLYMTGLDTQKLTTSESPDGSKIMIAYQESNENGELGYGFSRLGILDPKTGVLQLLTRDISGNPESFWGWLDNSTLVITAHSATGYFVYVYTFCT